MNESNLPSLEGDIWSVRGVPKELRIKLKKEAMRTGRTVGNIITGLLSEKFNNNSSQEPERSDTAAIEKRLERLEKALNIKNNCG